ncbi:Leucine-rich repeat domain superfamily [Sesbania bispinosa]|nr:Leucine-rich repeat domain superfamily [Sesbania bispinosa]
MQKMTKPLKIHMMNTAIKEFPESIGNLTGLEYIDMSICEGLKDLKSSFLLLPKFVTLKIDGCSRLGESFKRFKESNSVANGCPNLMTLHFSEANLSYEDLFAILEIFPKLEYLNVSHNEFVALPKCIKGSLKSLDVSFCRNLKEIPKLPLSIQKVDARHCRSLTSEASSVLWSKVSKEIQRIQVVMPLPKREIPDWFDHVCTQEIPLFWARRKFPIVALALVFQEVKKTDTYSEIEDAIELWTGFTDCHVVSLHLFIDGQEICGSDYHHFNVGKDHVLLCDLRVLFSDEEWHGLMQVLEMIGRPFKLPNPNSTRDYMPSSQLVPKGSPEQKMRHAEIERKLQPLSMGQVYAEHEESVVDVRRISGRLLKARVELMKENGLDIGMPIILEYADVGRATTTSRRFWGTLEINNEVSRSGWLANSTVPILLLKCQRPATEEPSSSGHEESLEEGHYIMNWKS